MTQGTPRPWSCRSAQSDQRGIGLWFVGALAMGEPDDVAVRIDDGAFALTPFGVFGGVQHDAGTIAVRPVWRPSREA